ncbi:hypothetical protein BA895_21100 [Humibacillus sp. DSM 29435]|uniref:lactonase family protein n=1 Tax=Humibacillus sp. DSM 29435 TaxID=1869167 RepID=UPI000872D6AE|nr:beta-propeller fold lactonase family protein [Humibacillus sp. DSM 29435]OFE16001.1 hypothetical protein BA895_21100 [Humibacillus sp. DSM 29435]
MTAQPFLLVGSYTPPLGSGSGITTFARDAVSGALQLRSEYLLESPSYLAAHPSLPLVYAVSEAEHGLVSTFEITPDGRLVLRGQVSSGGAGPCHCAVTADGEHLLVSNYGDGTVAVLPVDRRGNAGSPLAVVTRHGSGPDPDRQEAPHPHLALDLRDGTFLVADLGTDEVARYRIDAAGPARLVETVMLPPGTGPRQVAALARPSAGDDRDDALVVVGELGSNLTYLPHGIHSAEAEKSATAAQGPVGPGGTRTYPAHLEVAPGGDVLYLSNRGADCVSAFAVDDDGLRFVARVRVGAWPRHFAVVGSFLYVAAERGNAIDLVHSDHRSGSLEHLGEAARVNSPACILPITL